MKDQAEQSIDIRISLFRGDNESLSCSLKISGLNFEHLKQKGLIPGDFKSFATFKKHVKFGGYHETKPEILLEIIGEIIEMSKNPSLFYIYGEQGMNGIPEIHKSMAPKSKSD
jgi:hypothetical protein